MQRLYSSMELAEQLFGFGVASLDEQHPEMQRPQRATISMLPRTS